jgi:hypothetical protein
MDLPLEISYYSKRFMSIPLQKFISNKCIIIYGRSSLAHKARTFLHSSGKVKIFIEIFRSTEYALKIKRNDDSMGNNSFFVSRKKIN